MSAHDRGAFGALLAEAKTLGLNGIDFFVDFDVPDDSEQRWFVTGYVPTPTGKKKRGIQGVLADLFAPTVANIGQGRTGEEALRRLVEKLRT